MARLGSGTLASCRARCAGPATIARGCRSAWPISASAPSIAAIRPNSPTTCWRPVRPVGRRRHQPARAACSSPTSGAAGRPLHAHAAQRGRALETRVIGCLREVIDADTASAERGDRGARRARDRHRHDDGDGEGLLPSSRRPARSIPITPTSRRPRRRWPPRTVLGVLAQALERRRETGAGGVTLMSCDNIPANGRSLRAC